MKHLFLLVLVLLSCPGQSRAQKNALNIPGLLQLVGYSKSENKLQVTALNKQTQTSINEEANKTLLAKLKETYRTIRQRYNLLGTALNAADVGISARPVLQRILSDQQELLTLARKKPLVLPLVLSTETEFATHSSSLVNYLVGLCLSIGDINQMKASDRKVLFDYILSELGAIRELSGNLVASIRFAGLKDVIGEMNPFRNWVNTDKQLAGEILQNAKYLRR